jgi:phage tail tape-measure protein
MMSTAEKIRALSRDGASVSEIAMQLGIRYQHAYNVLKRSGLIRGGIENVPSRLRREISGSVKPALAVTTLLEGGFSLSGRWMLSSDGELIVDRPLPKEIGVYAFAKHGKALYVGVATMGLAKRLRFYRKPGSTQRTSQRLNIALKQELQQLSPIEIYTAQPPDLTWNDLPVNASAGLELGLIRQFDLPWNLRGTR